MEPEQILAEADRCVKCGYCLPHCPTYALSADEGESPRGRIALIQGLIQGAVDTPRLHEHLDSCLACRACEAACPSEVRYGELITAVRAVQKTVGQAPGPLHRLGLHLLSRAPYLKVSSSLAGIYQRLGGAALVNRLGGKTLGRLNGLMPTRISATSWKETYPANGESLGRVGLFTGCIGRIADRPALEASIRTLNRVGYEVVIPSNQVCCGAMHLHSGDSAEAKSLKERNQSAFSEHKLDAILGVATGCSSHLQEYSEDGTPLTAPVLDISSFLCNTPGVREIHLKPLNKRVAIHTPCSMKNILGDAPAPHRLLQQIPDIELFPLPENGLCCGAAGLYLITHPDSADHLREDKIDALRNSRAEILVTSNTGCALHMAAGIRAAGMKIEVLHPVELLARQLMD